MGELYSWCTDGHIDFSGLGERTLYDSAASCEVLAMRALPLRHLHVFSAPLLAALLLPAIALAGEPEELQSGAEQDPMVYGGTAAKPCGWPTAVYVAFSGWSCSGTLVHPDIIVTAAHCPNSTSGRQAQIRFGEGQGGGARQVSATCYSAPVWTGQVGGTDYGYCKLSSPVTDVPIIPPAWGCDTSALTIGREVVIVGFGQSDNGGSGSKREVTTVIQAIGDQAVIGGGGKDACQGDSGGPVYIKLKSEFGGDDTWRAFGITSGGGACGQGGIFALMHKAIPWIEQHSGIDITPCHDSEGNWEPTPSCGAIPLDPANTNGATWPNGCSGGPISGFSELCGEAFGSGEDQDPPSVAILDPISGQSFELPAGQSQMSVAVSATANDGDGFGVADVRLLINGQEFPGNKDSTAPYAWNLVFPQGGYLIEAIATDWVGNESAPDLISIGVGQAAPELPQSGDGDGDGDGPAGDGDGDGTGDGGGPDDGLGDDDLGIDGSDKGCACSSSDTDRRSGPLLGLLGLFGVLAVRRRRGPQALR
jgi:MYXO-CTERM domain-containing protein